MGLPTVTLALSVEALPDSVDASDVVVAMADGETLPGVDAVVYVPVKSASYTRNWSVLPPLKRVIAVTSSTSAPSHWAFVADVLTYANAVAVPPLEFVAVVVVMLDATVVNLDPYVLDAPASTTVCVESTMAILSESHVLSPSVRASRPYRTTHDSVSMLPRLASTLPRSYRCVSVWVALVAS